MLKSLLIGIVEIAFGLLELVLLCLVTLWTVSFDLWLLSMMYIQNTASYVYFHILRKVRLDKKDIINTLVIGIYNLVYYYILKLSIDLVKDMDSDIVILTFVIVLVLNIIFKLIISKFLKFEKDSKLYWILGQAVGGIIFGFVLYLLASVLGSVRIAFVVISILHIIILKLLLTLRQKQINKKNNKSLE